MDRIAVIGATGLIGASTAAALATRGFQIIGAARDISGAARRQPAIDWIARDLVHSSRAEWEALLQGVTAVVNCAGALQDGPSDDLPKAAHDGARRAHRGLPCSRRRSFHPFFCDGRRSSDADAVLGHEAGGRRPCFRQRAQLGDLTPLGRTRPVRLRRQRRSLEVYRAYTCR